MPFRGSNARGRIIGAGVRKILTVLSNEAKVFQGLFWRRVNKILFELCLSTIMLEMFLIHEGQVDFKCLSTFGIGIYRLT